MYTNGFFYFLMRLFNQFKNVSEIEIELKMEVYIYTHTHTRMLRPKEWLSDTLI